MKVKEMLWQETQLDWYCFLDYGHYFVSKKKNKFGKFTGKFYHTDMINHYSWKCSANEIKTAKAWCFEHHIRYVNTVSQYLKDGEIK